MLRDMCLHVNQSVYIPIWTIKDLSAALKVPLTKFVYIPIWTIKDLPDIEKLRAAYRGLHSNMDD